MRQEYPSVNKMTQNCMSTNREAIHSGHFMMSDFEAEALEDDDEEIGLPDPDKPLEEIVEPMPQQQLVLATATALSSDMQQLCRQQPSQLYIDTSLSNLLKCMRFTYRHKLTSPKWNHFKGIRLRWKEKIRLNNLIWRCWHMQFIMKKKTQCQFASPLDVDIHSKPEAVVLEGKYWKRQPNVIKAEYMKWRRFQRINYSGNQSVSDSISELDFLDWSPTSNDKSLMLPGEEYSWTTDTLLSAITGPFQFPDSKEIARFAGIADFIQPSLGPLQPNLDEFMDTISGAEFLDHARLPPVPEENTDEYSCFNMQAIMGPTQMDSSDLNAVKYSGTTMSNQSSQYQQQMQPDEQQQQQQTNFRTIEPTPSGMLQYSGKIFAHNMNPQQHQHPSIASTSPSSSLELGTDPSQAHSMLSSFSTNSNSNSNNNPIDMDTLLGSGGSVKAAAIKSSSPSRASRSTIRQYRRQPHNYEKTEPTAHQTNAYNHILAQKNQQQQSPQQSNYPQYFAPSQQQQNVYLQAANHILNRANAASNDGGMHLQTFNHQMVPAQQSLVLGLNSSQTGYQTMQQPSQLDTLKAVSSLPSQSYKPYPSIQPSYKQNYQQQQPLQHQQQNRMRIPSPPAATNVMMTDQLLPSDGKEMFRSNSLPLNATAAFNPQSQLQHKLHGMGNNKELDNFAVPKMYHTKSSVRSIRSNSTKTCGQGYFSPPNSSLQSATSEPMLHSNTNSTLTQLLISNNTTLSSKHNTSTSAIPSTSSTNAVVQKQQQRFHQIVNAGTAAISQNLMQQQQQPQAQPVSPSYSPNQVLAGSPLMGSHQQTSISSLSSSSAIPSSSTTTTPTLSPDSAISADHDSALSPTRGSSSSAFQSRNQSRDNQRRAGHIHAEQKRRCNIKSGFDTLDALIPQLQMNPNAKLSKATKLQKCADYIKQLWADRAAAKESIDALKRERDSLTNSLSHLQSILPASGAPVSRQRTGRVKDLCNQYINYKTNTNWKFWILGMICDPLLDSYNTTVSTATVEELYRTSMLWVDQHCSLVELRPAVSNKLRQLSTTTDILSDPPTTLREEAMKAVNCGSGSSSSSSSSAFNSQQPFSADYN